MIRNKGVEAEDMRESVARCLIFPADGAAAAVAASLGEQGIRVAQCAQRGECLDLLRLHRWPLLIIDAHGTTRSLVHVLAQSRRACPEVSIVVLVRHGDVEMAVEAMKAGAAECLELPVETARLLSLLDTLPRPVGREGRDRHAQLTPVERVVLQHILDDRTNRQIADLLSRSVRTIEVHRRNIMQKLGAANRVELVRKALCTSMREDDGGYRQQEAGDHHLQAADLGRS
jgi:two-component system response regulator FixJ